MPGVHGRQSLACRAPASGLKVPAGHGKSLPRVVPAGQYAPAGQSRGADDPAGQNDPAGHGSHDAARASALKVPAAHTLGTAEPSGQNDPAGHGPLVRLGDPGRAVDAFAVQKNPAAHGPVGATLPGSRQ